MAESPSPIVHRIVSASAYTQPRLIPAVLLSGLASLLLLLVLVAGGAVMFLATHARGPESAEADRGLLELLGSLPPGPWQTLAERVIRPLPLLHSSRSAVTALMAVMCVSLGLRWLFQSLARALVTSHVVSIVQRLRQHIHRKSIRLEPADLTGEQTRATDRLFRESTVALEQAAASWGQTWTTALPDLLAVAGLALLVHWRVALETLIPVVLCWYVLRLEIQRRDSSHRLLSEQADRGLRKLAEGLRKTRIVTGFSMEQQEQQQFEKHLVVYRDRCRQLRQQQEIGRWIQRLILLCGIFLPGCLLVWHALHPESLSFAAAGLLAACALLIVQTLQRLQQAPGYREEARVRADEISSYIARVPLVGQTVGARFMEPMTRTLLFDQVCLSLPQHARLLNNLDLRINSGETVALLSLQPLAAYALASMVPRFVDPDAGQVLIDGHDIRQATLESLRAEVVFVGGSDPVFNGTILENVTCGQADITRQQVQEACKLVHADHFIRNLPRGYDTVVGEHGASLDVGQTFRLSLARAVARKPAVLIIEEPQTPLDAETKAMLDDAYQRMAAGRTLMFLPFRLSTVKKCSRIVLVHEGRVAADDTHERLVRSSDLYRHWEYMRFNAFRDDSE